MKCPEEVLEAVLEILERSLLRIVNSQSHGSINQCQVEAYHVHNLPGLIKHYSPALLVFYLRTERLQFIRESENKHFGDFEPHWKKLEDFAQRTL
jgi:hypothetical protein